MINEYTFPTIKNDCTSYTLTAIDTDDTSVNVSTVGVVLPTLATASDYCYMTILDASNKEILKVVDINVIDSSASTLILDRIDDTHYSFDSGSLIQLRVVTQNITPIYENINTIQNELLNSYGDVSSIQYPQFVQYQYGIVNDEVPSAWNKVILNSDVTSTYQTTYNAIYNGVYGPAYLIGYGSSDISSFYSTGKLTLYLDPVSGEYVIDLSESINAGHDNTGVFTFFNSTGYNGTFATSEYNPKSEARFISNTLFSGPYHTFKLYNDYTSLEYPIDVNPSVTIATKSPTQWDSNVYNGTLYDTRLFGPYDSYDTAFGKKGTINIGSVNKFIDVIRSNDYTSYQNFNNNLNIKIGKDASYIYSITDNTSTVNNFYIDILSPAIANSPYVNPAISYDNVSILSNFNFIRKYSANEFNLSVGANVYSKITRDYMYHSGNIKSDEFLTSRKNVITSISANELPVSAITILDYSSTQPTIATLTIDATNINDASYAYVVSVINMGAYDATFSHGIDNISSFDGSNIVLSTNFGTSFVYVSDSGTWQQFKYL